MFLVYSIILVFQFNEYAKGAHGRTEREVISSGFLQGLPGTHGPPVSIKYTQLHCY